MSKRRGGSMESFPLMKYSPLSPRSAARTGEGGQHKGWKHLGQLQPGASHLPGSEHGQDGGEMVSALSHREGTAGAGSGSHTLLRVRGAGLGWGQWAGDTGLGTSCGH